MTLTPPQGAHSADRFTKFDYLLNAFEQASQAPEPAKLNYGDKRKALYAHVRELERRTALAAPRPEPEKFNLHDVVPPSAPEWVEGNRASVSSDWMSGWDACRNRTRLLVIGLVAAMRQALAAPEGPAPTEAEKDAAYALGRAHEREAVFAELRLELDHAKDQASGNGGNPRYDYYADCIEMLLSNFEGIAPEAPPPVEARQPPNLNFVHDVLQNCRGMLPEKDGAHAEIGKAMEIIRAALAAPAGAIQRGHLGSTPWGETDDH